MEELAQQAESMIERNIGHLAMKGKEVQVFVEILPEPRVGFISGLDSEFIQICLTSDQTLANIRRDSVISLDETGNTIGTYVKSEGLSEESLRRLQDRVRVFKRRAMFVYGAKLNAPT